MLTKAIVEELISPHEARVRVPRLDRVNDSAAHTATEDLTIATICTLPNCYLNVQVGDIVFVAYEDNTERKLVILGHLSRDAFYPSAADIVSNNLDVQGKFTCTENIQIGADVTYQDLEKLSGVTDNIQKQFDYLRTDIDKLFTLFDSLSNKG